MPLWNRKALIGFVVWNLAVLCLWIWSREGSIVHLKFVVNNKSHCMYVDGKETDCFNVNPQKMIPNGKAGVGLSQHSRPPLIVLPQEFDDLVVRSLDDNQVLLKETFDSNLDDWLMVRGEFHLNDRDRLVAPSLALGAIGEKEWKNYSIEATCYNLTEAYLLFRVQDKKNYGIIKIRFWRELVISYSYFKDGKKSFNRIKSLAEPVEGAAKTIVLRFVKTYVVACLILLGFLTLFILTSLLLRPFMGEKNGSEQ